ncbi:hypothetical protein QUF58_08805 [Anaerolineales bacterium HSG24]|nr:hypothetical protein [Anaerolineales bacterium HSG24]
MLESGRNIEASVEGGLNKSESKTEHIERRLEEIDSHIKHLEESIAKLQGQESNQAVVASLKEKLTQQKQEKDQEQQKAEQLLRELDDVFRELQATDKQNTEAQTEVSKLSAAGLDVSDAVNRTAERANWIEQKEEHYRELRRRAGKLASSSGGL